MSTKFIISRNTGQPVGEVIDPKFSAKSLRDSRFDVISSHAWREMLDNYKGKHSYCLYGRVTATGFNVSGLGEEMDIGQKKSLRKAATVATYYHNKQKRSFGSGDPYIYHPERCANLAKTYGYDLTIRAALWLHDVIEMTDYLPNQLIEEFPRDIYNMVLGLTDPLFAKAQSRAERNTVRIKKLSQFGSDTQTAKFIDRYDNLNELLTNKDLELPDGFLQSYYWESVELYEGLTDGDSVARDELHRILNCIALCYGYEQE